MNIIKRVFDHSEHSEAEIATLIESFANGSSGSWDWDDFVSVQHTNERIEAARVACLKVEHEFPGGASRWCNDDGLERLRAIAAQLRASAR